MKFRKDNNGDIVISRVYERLSGRISCGECQGKEFRFSDLPTIGEVIATARRHRWAICPSSERDLLIEPVSKIPDGSCATFRIKSACDNCIAKARNESLAEDIAKDSLDGLESSIRRRLVENSPNVDYRKVSWVEWAALLSEASGLVAGNATGRDGEEFRQSLMDVAALAVTAVWSFDRDGEEED